MSRLKNLLEMVLTSEFTFGFELEAYALDLYGKLFQKGLGGDSSRETIDKTLKKQFSKFFGNDIEIGNDASLNTDFPYAACSFEFPTPVMSLTPANVMKCINFLEYCVDNGIVTDNHCGFHVHYAFPNITDQDRVWIVCQIALSDKYFNELANFEVAGGTLPFYSMYANPAFFQEIRNCFTKDGCDYKKLSELLTTEKYRLLRIHPQGTLEWRGPRNFLDSGNHPIIKEFFFKLVMVARIFSKCLDEKSINGISRREFEKNVDYTNISSDNYGAINVTTKQLAREFVKSPLKALKFRDYRLLDYVQLVNDIEYVLRVKKMSSKDFWKQFEGKHFKSKRLLAAIILRYPDFLNTVPTISDRLIDTCLDTDYLQGIELIMNNNTFDLMARMTTISREAFNKLFHYGRIMKPFGWRLQLSNARDNAPENSCLNSPKIPEWIQEELKKPRG